MKITSGKPFWIITILFLAVIVYTGYRQAIGNIATPEQLRRELPPDANDPLAQERAEQRRSNPNLVRVEAVAKDWKLVKVTCDKDAAIRLADVNFLWHVSFPVQDNSSAFDDEASGYGRTIDIAARHALDDYKEVVARHALERLRKQREQDQVKKELENCCKETH